MMILTPKKNITIETAENQIGNTWKSALVSMHFAVKKTSVGLLWPWPLIFDLQNITMSSLGATEYSLSVLSKVFKPFMRYRSNKICQNERTNEWRTDGRTDSPKT